MEMISVARPQVRPQVRNRVKKCIINSILIDRPRRGSAKELDLEPCSHSRCMIIGKL